MKHLLVHLIVAVLTLAFVSSAPVPVFAQDLNRRLERSLNEAMDDYDVLQIQDAERKLEDAIRFGDEQNISGPIMARLWSMLGVVRFAARRDAGEAVEAFLEALDQDPNAEVDPLYQTPTLTQLMDRARREHQQRAPTEPQITSITHTPLRTARNQEPIQLEILVPGTLQVHRVILRYRRFDEQEFQAAEMEASGPNTYTTSLPGPAVRSSQIQYFIEVLDRQGEVLGGSGSEDAPNTIVVIGGDATEPPDDDRDPDTPPIEVVDGERRQYVYLNLLGGSGLAFLPGGTPTANPAQVAVQPGFVPVFGHALVDIGGIINPDMHLGVYFRFQFAPAQNFDNLPPESVDPGSGFWNSKEECLGLGLPGDCLLGLKYKWFFVNHAYRIYSSFGAGVGRVRNWLRVQKLTSPSNPEPICVGKEIFTDGSGRQFCYVRDTVRTGWFHFGAGSGFVWPLTGFLDLVVDGYLMLHVPDTSVNLDLSAGLNFRF